MNKVSERLALFQELLLCNFQVFCWTYRPDFTIEKTNCPQDLFASDATQIPSFSESIRQFIEKDGHHPLFLDSALGMLWIADFEWNQAQLVHIHLIGPVYAGKNSHQLLKKELDKRNLTITLRAKIFHQIDRIPIIPTTTMLQYATMFHYCITQEHISSTDVCFPTSNEVAVSESLANISSEHLGIWTNEQELMQMIRDGNPKYRELLERSSSLSNGLKFDVGDAMRQAKNSVLVLLTLSSRAAIEGGLSPMISYSLNDTYAGKIESCNTISALSILTNEMLEDYVNRVRKAKEQSEISALIRNSCDYITMHLSEPLDIASLAKRSGYSEYYFSHKFKKETGCSVADYIKRARIEQAKLLLSSSTESIQDICDDLDFGSRSHFTTTFTKITGISPTEYRKKNYKN